MSLESLCNELLLDVFDFLHAMHFLRAFHGLNSRFDALLYDHTQRYNLDFRLSSRSDIRRTCQEQLPLIIDRVAVLHLGDSEETSYVSDLFISYDVPLNQFIHLQYLGLHDLYSAGTSMNLVQQCRYLPCLTQLRIIGYTFWDMTDFVSFIHQIWQLPKLLKCNLRGTILYRRRFTGLTVISSSIESLTIHGFCFASNDLVHLIEHTPHLQYLSIDIQCVLSVPVPQPHSLMLTRLNLRVHRSFDVFVNLLQNTPCLSHLILDLEGRFLNGYEWETIILEHVPRLKIFRLRMLVNFLAENNLDEQVDQILTTFRTPFWLDAYNWFVRCDYSPRSSSEKAYLYTLPCAFDMIHSCAVSSKWTCPHIRDYCSYDQVHHIQTNSAFFRTHVSILPIRFPNIRHLDIAPLLPNVFWLIFPTFNQLTSLHLCCSAEQNYSQVQRLMAQTSHLYSLKLTGDFNFTFIVFALTCRSIRRLDLLHNEAKERKYFNHRQCKSFARSTLGQQCEVLRIGVQESRTVVDLIESLPHLRTLISHCDNIKEKNKSIPLRSGDPFIHFYQERLSTASSIFRDRETDFLHIWMDK